MTFIRQPSESPTMMVGRLEAHCYTWGVADVRLIDGPFKGCRHMAAQASQPMLEGQLVKLDNGAWYPVKEGE